MVEGIHLSLMIGPAVPVPVGRDVVDALTRVRITQTTEGPGGFQLTFTLSKGSPLETLFLVTGGASIPIVRVVLIATVRGTPEVLMDGVMTNHEVSPGENGGSSTLTVTGEDLSKVMDLIALDGVPFPGMPDVARVALMLAKYAVLGVIPLVIPSILLDVPNPLQRIPGQRGTDLAYIRQLAERVGYVFYVDPGPAPGTSTAYWGPEIKVGPPQPALNVDMDAHRNVESLTFSYDAQAAELPILMIHNQETKATIPIPVPDITPLNPPLGAIPPIPQKITPIRTGRRSPVQAAAIGLARAAKRSEVVTGTGSLDVVRYGRVLRARRLVGVRGAGPAFDGLHYVKSVTHNLQRGQYTQDFTLSRNGLISTVPRVTP